MPKRTVAVIIITSENKVLLQLRDDKPDIRFPNMWSLPGGYIDNKEAPKEAAKREIYEELEIKMKKISFFKEIITDGDLLTQVFLYKTKLTSEKDINFHEG